MLGRGFEPRLSARKAEMIGRTTPTERSQFQRRMRLFAVYSDCSIRLIGSVIYKTQLRRPLADSIKLITVIDRLTALVFES